MVAPPGSAVHGILQARILEWVAISSSRESSQPRDQTQVSPVSPALAGIFFTTEPPGTLFSQAYRELKIGLIFKICIYMCGHSQTCLTTQVFSQGSRHTVKAHFLGPWLSRKATYKQETKCGWGKSGNKMWKSLDFWSCVQLGNCW